MLLSRLPSEVLEIIHTYLDLETIKALRLVHRELSIRCIGPRFLRHVRQPSTDLTKESLASLDALCQNPTLRQNIHELTILAVYYAANEANVRLGRQPAPNDWRQFQWPAPNLESDVRWLEQQRAAQERCQAEEVINQLITIFKRLKSLERVKLDVSVILGPKRRVKTQLGVWLETWTTASKVHDLTLAAIAKSGIRLTSLDIYRETPNCAVFLPNYAYQMGRLDLMALGTNLQNLQLSLCTEIDDLSWEREYGLDIGTKLLDRSFGTVYEIPRGNGPQTAAAKAIPGLVELLQATPNLHHLDLHLYHFPVDFDECHSIFTAIADQVTLPRLQSLSLSGFPLTEASVLRFLSNHAGLQTLILQEIHLVQGTWTPVFSHISRNIPSLTTVRFATLWWNLGNKSPATDDTRPTAPPKEVVNLHTTWDEEPPVDLSKEHPRNGGDFFSPVADEYLVHRRTFTAGDLRRGLVFRPTPEGGLNPWRKITWKNNRHQAYGPPKFNLMMPPRRGPSRSSARS